ncbi:Por secretion system C-terminal sorting domain-containing protein [Cyclonatronum proteinivorum]|uniref:Por secretion system C-terminal sorting domain-containing protein n=1 Tax=Cyclonatronum proteinivorum TaxID=1457365 RepID=A0A345UHW0_9BACT|nr:T9SS type A sorting domain-containing protein [Cyclonatronum proteinivorum]AXJ00062.1 Por secretion system C-terminal sorting domain-containing protein [Cyclonatronum proteinivorum]
MKHILTALCTIALLMAAPFAVAQQGPQAFNQSGSNAQPSELPEVCTGTWTEAAEGSFDDGFTYQFTSIGNVVRLEVELLDPKEGLVAFAQTYNPNFNEVQMDHLGGQRFGRPFSGNAEGSTFRVAVKFAFAGGLATSTIIEHIVGDCEVDAPSNGINFPITFNDPDLDYELFDFGDNQSQIIQDPTDPANRVVESVKLAGAATWAGTTVANDNGFILPIPFSPGNTIITARVWSPVAGIPVRMKVEDHTNVTVSVETEATVTEAGVWQTLEFDFSNEAPGTEAINFDRLYTKASMFFDFGTEGTGETFYWDDLIFAGGGGGGEEPPPASLITLPVTFEDPDLDYQLDDFGGNSSVIVADPTNADNRVVQSTKGAGAELWAGTTVARMDGFAEPIPFSPGNTTMSVRVWSPVADIPVRMKVEDHTNGALSVETEVMLTVANEWHTLEFDFAQPAPGTPAINFNTSYTMASVFFDFGTTGAESGERTYFWDDVTFTGEEGGTDPPPASDIELPITFQDPDLDYELVDFGDTVSEIINFPIDPTNRVVQTLKPEGAATWAGTTVADVSGFSEPIPFDPDNTTMTLRVWSPVSNVPVRLKVEDHTDVTVSVETEAMITVPGEWQTLTFDFANQAPGTEFINFDKNYTKASVFFDFGSEGNGVFYYWDDLAFGSGPGTEPPTTVTLPVSFEEDLDWSTIFTDFDGGAASVVANPDPSGINTSGNVGKMVKGEGAPWAGSSFFLTNPLEIGDVPMSVQVWAPRDDSSLLFKIENGADAGQFFEAEQPIPVANEWTELTFDLSGANQAFEYDRIVLIFDLGEIGDGSENFTWYFDNIGWLGTTSLHPELADVPVQVSLNQNYPNPFNPTTQIQFTLPVSDQVRLEVYNLMGQRVATLINDTVSAGTHTVTFDAGSLASGMYLYRLQSGSVNLTRKMMLVR